MKKSVGFLLTALIFLICLLPTISSAHLSGQNGTINATIVIEPENPIALESASFRISFSDSANYFTLKRCLCTLSVKNDSGRTIFSTPLLQNEIYINEQISPIPFTFPHVGNYTIEIAGTSTNLVFKPFVITFDQKITSKHVPPWIVKVKAWANSLFSDVLPVILILVILPLGWKFLVVRKK